MNTQWKIESHIKEVGSYKKENRIERLIGNSVESKLLRSLKVKRHEKDHEGHIEKVIEIHRFSLH